MQINDTIDVKFLGQVTKGTVKLADLTVLVGPQSSGKSLFLQWLKLIADSDAIINTLKKYGFDWKNDFSRFATLYFGEGMDSLWVENSEIRINEKPFQITEKISQSRPKPETMFLMPAQRVITLRTGWPLPFSDYGMDSSFATKNFSESMRQLMSWGVGTSDSDILFPSTPGLFNQEFIKQLNASIFCGATVVLEQGLQKRIMLELENKKRLPYMVWSTGQREFVPLLLGLYWLLSTLTTNRVEWVIIEEPEMGLHPKAISAVLLFLIQLLSQDYKLIISTHSAHVLDVIWAIQEIKRNQATPELFLEIFDANHLDALQETATEIVQNKQFKTYYFCSEQQGTQIKDISELPLGNDNQSDWGGLTEFSSRVAHVVANAVRQNIGNRLTR
jgi:hypothetical protein